MFISPADWIRKYQEKDALWIHEGNPNRPHVILTTGNHSNGFFNSQPILEDDDLLLLATKQLIYLFGEEEGNLYNINVFVGPPKGAKKLAKFLSEESEKITGRRHEFASPAKHETDGRKSMIFSEEDLEIFVGGERVLLCEDVITTGESVELAAEAVVSAGGITMPFVLTLVNRSGLTEVNGRKIIALINHHLPIWAPEDCPLCKAGSEAIPAKDNWARLNAP